ncbi:hypothetical protein [Xylanimonas sp. McL0601]|uniref:hypothetical protein n=1 Tax=Xylanimonas sp. McL0601 TaxID=3414739 RepID=UPI003CEDF746
MSTQKIVDRARLWADYYSQVQAQRTLVRLDAERALAALKARLVPVTAGGRVVSRVLPVGPGDVASLRAVSRAVTMPPVDPDDGDTLRQLADAVPEALADVDAAAGAKRLLALPAARQAAADAIEFLTEYVTWGEEHGLGGALRRMEPGAEPEGLTPADALAPQVGLRAIWRDLGTAELIEVPASAAAPAGQAATPDVTALRAAIAVQAPTHLAVFSVAGRTAAELLAALSA